MPVEKESEIIYSDPENIARNNTDDIPQQPTQNPKDTESYNTEGTDDMETEKNEQETDACEKEDEGRGYSGNTQDLNFSGRNYSVEKDNEISSYCPDTGIGNTTADIPEQPMQMNDQKETGADAKEGSHTVNVYNEEKNNEMLQHSVAEQTKETVSAGVTEDINSTQKRKKWKSRRLGPNMYFYLGLLSSVLIVSFCISYPLLLSDKSIKNDPGTLNINNEKRQNKISLKTGISDRVEVSGIILGNKFRRGDKNFDPNLSSKKDLANMHLTGHFNTTDPLLSENTCSLDYSLSKSSEELSLHQNKLNADKRLEESSVFTHPRQENDYVSVKQKCKSLSNLKEIKSETLQSVANSFINTETEKTSILRSQVLHTFAGDDYSKREIKKDLIKKCPLPTEDILDSRERFLIKILSKYCSQAEKYHLGENKVSNGKPETFYFNYSEAFLNDIFGCIIFVSFLFTLLIAIICKFEKNINEAITLPRNEQRKEVATARTTGNIHSSQKNNHVEKNKEISGFSSDNVSENSTNDITKQSIRKNDQKVTILDSKEVSDTDKTENNKKDRDSCDEEIEGLSGSETTQELNFSEETNSIGKNSEIIDSVPADINSTGDNCEESEQMNDQKETAPGIKEGSNTVETENKGKVRNSSEEETGSLIAAGPTQELNSSGKTNSVEKNNEITDSVSNHDIGNDQQNRKFIKDNDEKKVKNQERELGTIPSKNSADVHGRSDESYSQNIKRQSNRKRDLNSKSSGKVVKLLTHSDTIVIEEATVERELNTSLSQTHNVIFLQQGDFRFQCISVKNSNFTIKFSTGGKFSSKNKVKYLKYKVKMEKKPLNESTT
ncbi:hypothetical protein AVEN_101012-1 [Araneus ventricosus]|uniref:Uncharacterized protein n=1 Tax=Araneus ventricosus TaxID=182803 RepID=A0A4Y2N6X6_ARAVE|nr:hypothetical protein AVEN_101012-1 [Araneus ventricosus]